LFVSVVVAASSWRFCNFGGPKLVYIFRTAKNAGRQIPTRQAELLEIIATIVDKAATATNVTGSYDGISNRSVVSGRDGASEPTTRIRVRGR
jgi:hypothetical protein